MGRSWGIGLRVLVGAITLLVALAPSAAPQGAKIVPLAVDRQAFSFGLESDFALSPSAKQHFWRVVVPNTTDADFEAMLFGGIPSPPCVGNMVTLDPNTDVVAAPIESAVTSLIAQAQADPAYAQDTVLNHSPSNPRVIQLLLVETVDPTDLGAVQQRQVIGTATLWLTGASQHELKGYFVAQSASINCAGDTTPPITVTTLSSAANPAGWYNSAVAVTLSAADNPGGSGVKEIVYSATGAQTSASTTVSGNSASVSLTTEGVTTLTYQARDNAGNQEPAQTLTVRIDKTAPTISTPAAVSVGNAPGKNGATVTLANPTSSDNIEVVSLASVPTSGTFFLLGTTLVTWTARDAAGNQVTATQKVTVSDVEAPQLTCPANITRPHDNGKKTAVVAITAATATDNCGTAAVVGIRSDGKPISDPYPQGITTIRWTATDPTGNRATCTQTVTVTK